MMLEIIVSTIEIITYTIVIIYIAKELKRK